MRNTYWASQGQAAARPTAAARRGRGSQRAPRGAGATGGPGRARGAPHAAPARARGAGTAHPPDGLCPSAGRRRRHRTAGGEGLGPRPATPRPLGGAGALGGGRSGPDAGKAASRCPGRCGVPGRGRGWRGPGVAGAGGGVPGAGAGGAGRKRGSVAPSPGEGHLTEIDVAEGAAADLPAQPVPVPDSELHGGGGPGSLLPSRPLPGSELG